MLLTLKRTTLFSLDPFSTDPKQTCCISSIDYFSSPDLPSVAFDLPG
jgi:hypothetical protein